LRELDLVLDVEAADAVREREVASCELLYRRAGDAVGAVLEAVRRRLDHGQAHYPLFIRDHEGDAVLADREVWRAQPDHEAGRLVDVARVRPVQRRAGRREDGGRPALDRSRGCRRSVLGTAAGDGEGYEE